LAATRRPLKALRGSRWKANCVEGSVERNVWKRSELRTMVLFRSWGGMWTFQKFEVSKGYCRYECKRLCVCSYWILREAVSCVQKL
jgi:hypothetical protein